MRFTIDFETSKHQPPPDPSLPVLQSVLGAFSEPIERLLVWVVEQIDDIKAPQKGASGSDDSGVTPGQRLDALRSAAELAGEVDALCGNERETVETIAKRLRVEYFKLSLADRTDIMVSYDRGYQKEPPLGRKL